MRVTLEKKNISSRIYPGLDLQWKIVDADQGLIRGYLAVFNNIDSTNDRIRPGAFKKTIAEALQRKDNRGKKFLWPLLFMHDPEKPIGGFIDAVEDKTGLLVTAQLDITTNEQGTPLNPLAMSTFSGFKMGYIDELSIGYKAIQKSYEPGSGVRDLTEIQNFEGSAVTMNFAANELAQVSSVKTKGKTTMNTKDFSGYYRERQIADWLNRYVSLTSSLRSAVVDAFNIGDQPEQDVQAALSGTDGTPGFTQALMDWVAEGIALNASSYTKQPDVDSLDEYDLMGYMSRQEALSVKAGAVVSQANADRMKEHINTLMQCKDSIHTVAQDISHYITGDAPAFVDPATGKTAKLEPSVKILNEDQSSQLDTDLEQFAMYLALRTGNKLSN